MRHKGNRIVVMGAAEMLSRRRGDDVYIHYSGHGQLMTDRDGDNSMLWESFSSRLSHTWNTKIRYGLSQYTYDSMIFVMAVCRKDKDNYLGIINPIYEAMFLG